MSPPAASADNTSTPAPATAAQIEGPFYRSDAPYRTNLCADDPDGAMLSVGGLVRAADTGAPVPGAILDVWQSDHVGNYDTSAGSGDDPPPAYRLRGKMTTDDQGHYAFETIIPANYPLAPDTPQLRARHIHFKVFADGYMPLTTQMYFTDDPYLDLDPFADQQLAVHCHQHTLQDDRPMRSRPGPVATCIFNLAVSRSHDVGPGEQSGPPRQAGAPAAEVSSGVMDGNERNTALLAAVQRGDVQAVRAALSGGARADARTREGVTGLMYACAGGAATIVRLLLDSGADVHARSADGMTALMFAASAPKSENLDIVQALLDRGTLIHPCESTQGLNALMFAALSGHQGIAHLFLERGADANSSDAGGLRVLHYAVYSGNAAMVRLLLSCGADATTTSLNGSTALMVLSPRSTPAMVSLLVAKGAAVNGHNQMGGTPLMAAVVSGNIAIVRSLLEQGADVHLKSRAGWTALMWAAHTSNTEIVRVLRTHGATA